MFNKSNSNVKKADDKNNIAARKAQKGVLMQLKRQLIVARLIVSEPLGQCRYVTKARQS